MVKGSKRPGRPGSKDPKTKKVGEKVIKVIKGYDRAALNGLIRRTKKHRLLQHCAKAVPIVSSSIKLNSAHGHRGKNKRCWYAQLEQFHCFNCTGITNLVPFCTQCCHTEGFEIRKSNIPKAEFGLFTTRAFKPFKVVLPYIGHILSDEQSAERYGPSAPVQPYVWGRIDAAFRRPWAAMVNTAEPPTSNNLVIYKYPVEDAPVTCPDLSCPGCAGCTHYLTNPAGIKKDTELYWDYGPDYIASLGIKKQPTFTTTPALNDKRFRKATFSYCQK